MEKLEMAKIVIFCGGRGAQGLIKSLVTDNELSLIVNAYDDGHSTGRLRELFDILGPSDCRKNCEYLLNENIDIRIRDLFAIRLPVGFNVSDVIESILSIKNKIKKMSKLSTDSLDIATWILKSIDGIIEKLHIIGIDKSLSDCSFMNLMLVNEVINHGSFQTGVDVFSSSLNIKNKIILNSEDNLSLVALTRSGHILLSEGEIVEGRSSEIIDELFLIPHSLRNNIREKVESSTDFYKKIEILNEYHELPSLNPMVSSAINDADIIIYSSGTVNSSIYPSYLTQNISEIISESSAKKIMITNIGADYETPDFKASDFVKQSLRFLGHSFNADSDYFKSQSLIDVVFINQSHTLDKHHIVNDYRNLVFQVVNVQTGDYEDPYSQGRHGEQFFDNISKYISSNS
jgi:2-phospho-L-lactate transferase/gluconeogenesis factor (CofD/UPF0052 family)